MIRSTFISAVAVAAMMAVPAFANNSAKQSSTANPAIVSGSTQATVNSNAIENPRATPTQNNVTANNELPPCSSLQAGKSGRMQPNAGKLADKSTGKAKLHSKSAVHEDCLPDTTSSTISSTTPSTTSTMPSTAPTTASTAPSTTMPSGTMGSTMSPSTTNTTR